MIAKEVKELIVSMEVSADTMLKAEAMLEPYAETEEVPEDLINEILKVIDTDFNPEEVVKDSDEMPQL